MRYLAAITFLIFSFSLSAQEPKEEPEVNMYTTSLQKGELFNFGNKSIKFLEVISDSRCPKDVTCIWAGEAKLLLGVFEDGKFMKEMVVTQSPSGIPYNIPLNSSIDEIAYFISGLELYPYPSTAQTIPQEEYSLKIYVKEKI